MPDERRITRSPAVGRLLPSARIVTRGGRRAPFIAPSPSTVALIESLKPAFEEQCGGTPLTGGKQPLNTHRRDGSSRRQKFTPKRGAA